MSQELRDLMVRTAENAPTARVDPETWRAARRARRRERLLVPVAAAVVLVGVVVLGGQVPSLVVGADDAGPVAGRSEPAMPSRLYPVPEHLDLRTPEGRWAYPAAENLKLGVTAVAFTTAGGHAPFAVSAEDGRYRLLDLPGHDPMTGFRFKDGNLALSPDGRRLAYTWNDPPEDGPRDEYVPSGVRIVDLTTGEVESHQVRKGYGVLSHGFSWSPNGRYLAYNTQIANTSRTGTSGVRNFFVERIDTETGERLKAGGLPMADHPPAVSDDGTVVTGRNLDLWTWRPDRGTSRVELTASPQWRGSVAGVSAMPGTDEVLVSAGLEYSRLYAGLPDSPRSFRRLASGARSLSPVGPVDEGRQVVFERTLTSTALWTIRTTSPRLNDRSDGLVQFEGGELGSHYSFATALLQRPTRDFPAPDWPWSTEQKALLGGLVVLLVGAGGVVVLTLRRRRGLGPKVS
jgi:hypothetical protein